MHLRKNLSLGDPILEVSTKSLEMWITASFRANGRVGCHYLRYVVIAVDSYEAKGVELVLF